MLRIMFMNFTENYFQPLRYFSAFTIEHRIDARKIYRPVNHVEIIKASDSSAESPGELENTFYAPGESLREKAYRFSVEAE